LKRFSTTTELTVQRGDEETFTVISAHGRGDLSLRRVDEGRLRAAATLMFRRSQGGHPCG
jgi:hypothetical protein